MTAPARRLTTVRRSAQLLFWSWFNVKAFRRARETANWTEERFRFWLTFTLRSVLDQREADWRYWLVCSRALRHLTDPLQKSITDPRVKMVFDDECSDRLARLPQADRYLLVRIDSDDLYHPVAASTLLKQRPITRFLQFNRGFALDVRTGHVLPWRSRSSPFYTHVYGEEIRRLDVWEEPNHTAVARSAHRVGLGPFPGVAPPVQHLDYACERGGWRPAHRAVDGDRWSVWDRRRPPVGRACCNSATPRPLGAALARATTRARTLVNEVNACLEERPLSLIAVALLQLACEITAVRRVAVIDDVPAAVALRSRGVATCDLFVSSPAYATAVRDALPTSLALYATVSAAAPEQGAYDVVYVDMRRVESDLNPLRSALSAIAVTGLLVIAGVDPVRGDILCTTLASVIVDRYPEIEARAMDASGKTCWLLGRALTS